MSQQKILTSRISRQHIQIILYLLMAASVIVHVKTFFTILAFGRYLGISKAGVNYCSIIEQYSMLDLIIGGIILLFLAICIIFRITNRIMQKCMTKNQFKTEIFLLLTILFSEIALLISHGIFLFQINEEEANKSLTEMQANKVLLAQIIYCTLIMIPVLVKIIQEQYNKLAKIYSQAPCDYDYFGIESEDTLTLL